MVAELIKGDAGARRGMQTARFSHEDHQSIPYSAFREILSMVPASHPVRVGVLLLALTGCRVKELDRMGPDGLVDGWLHWRLGKNQRGYRREPLPDWFLAELKHYRRTHRVPEAQLLGYRSGQLTTYFNKFVRPHLGPAWQLRRPCRPGRVADDQYDLQLKGLRKSFATTVFWTEYRRWRDAGVALSFSSKRLQHKTTHMTAFHYLKEFSVTEAALWAQFLEGERQPPVQTILMEF
jgi:integrase